MHLTFDTDRIKFGIAKAFYEVVGVPNGYIEASRCVELIEVIHDIIERVVFVREKLVALWRVRKRRHSGSIFIDRRDDIFGIDWYDGYVVNSGGMQRWHTTGILVG